MVTIAAKKMPTPCMAKTDPTRAPRLLLEAYSDMYVALRGLHEK